MEKIVTSLEIETPVAEELTEADLESVIGGALLLPAVQKVRDYSSGDRPTETLSLNF